MTYKKPINIVCATDDNYAPYCGVMLTSVFENNKDREVNAYILVDKPLQESSQKKMQKLSTLYGQNINYCMVDNSVFQKYPLRGYGAIHGQWTIVIYYRLLVEELLPVYINEVLYLDCDIIVNDSLGELFDMDWTDIGVGVSPDMSYNLNEFYQRLQYDEAKGYFNSGMVFINLVYWRAHGIGKKCMDFLHNYYDRVWNPDQDVLNVVLCDKKRTLPVSFNYQVQFLMPFFFRHLSRSNAARYSKNHQACHNPLCIRIKAMDGILLFLSVLSNLEKIQKNISLEIYARSAAEKKKDCCNCQTLFYLAFWFLA